MTTTDRPPLDWRAAPRRGTPKYRLLVLQAAAAETYDAFEEALRYAWPAYGWRLTVDLVAEMLTYLGWAVPAASPHRDGFGRLNLARLMPEIGEEQRMAITVMMAHTDYAGMPPHESFAQALEASAEMEEVVSALRPAWQGALDAMQAAHWDQGPGIAVLAGFLAGRPDRNAFAYQAAFVSHAYLRTLALPEGDGWVGEWAARPPGDPGRRTPYEAANPLLSDRPTPYLM